MKELLAIIIILLMYISIQLTSQHKQPVIVSKKETIQKPLLQQDVQTIVKAPENNQPEKSIHNIPTVIVNHPHCHQSVKTNPPNGIPINVPTRGPSENYRQIGVLTNSDNSEIIPLFGKRIYCGATKWLYYTQTNKFVSVHLPIFKDKRDCSAEYGCDELFDKDTVTVPQFNDSFTVTLYHLEEQRYIPYIN